MLQLALLIVDVGLLVVTLLELRSRTHKTPDRVRKSGDYHPTFSAVGLTLLLLGGLLLLIVSYAHPQALSIFWNHAALIREGVKYTVLVSVLAILLGSAIGITAALLLAAPKKNVFFSLIDSVLLSTIYVLLGIPAVVFLFICYYLPPRHTVSIFWASVLALGINLAPFVAKILVASIRNISDEQIDAATSFGYNRWQRFRFFELAFVVKNAGQALLVEYYTTIKLSSLASFIYLHETFWATQQIITITQDTVSAYIIMAACYVLIVTWIAVLADYLAQKWQPIAN